LAERSAWRQRARTWICLGSLVVIPPLIRYRMLPPLTPFDWPMLFCASTPPPTEKMLDSSTPAWAPLAA